MPATTASLLTSPSPDGVCAHACTGAEHGPLTTDEHIIGVVLTVRWMLLTRRRLGQAPLFHDLEHIELIDFWADDHLSLLTSR